MSREEQEKVLGTMLELAHLESNDREFARYLDGSLPTEIMELYNRHIAKCSRCREAVEFMREAEEEIEPERSISKK